MTQNNKQKCIIYIGDFDLRNQNVQAHLVKNNGKILNRLGYKVAFIGVNREATYEEIDKLPSLEVGEGNLTLEVENTLTTKGILKYRDTANRIQSFMNDVAKNAKVEFVISYQAPTYALILKKIAKWSRQNGAKYIVNSADLPVFSSQPFFRRTVMSWNWYYLHKTNKRYADGIIAVSRYIERFYHKDGILSVIIPPLFDNYADYAFELAEIPTFVYAGTPFILKKNINISGMKDRLDIIVDLCLQLTKNNVKYRLLVIGITKDFYVTCIPRHKSELANNKDIQFVGRYSHEDTMKAVRNADYMINYRDINIMNEAGLSTKLVESVSLGTPVVMNSVGDTFLYLKEGITGFKLYGESEKDVEVLKSLSNKTEEERKVLKNQCAGDRTFTLDKYTAKLSDFLEAVLSNRN